MYDAWSTATPTLLQKGRWFENFSIDPHDLLQNPESVT